MTVVDVNTGKFIGQGGNLEETVTRNNIEAAEEIVRQLRLRDVGGIIVVDFIDMVLESNRDLVLRRLLECLGRDRTKHQVAEVTSLGLVQMTRKKIGQGLLEVFSENCEHCNGRGVIVHTDPVESKAVRSDGSERQLPARRDNEGMAVVAAARSLADKAERPDKAEHPDKADEVEGTGSAHDAEDSKGGKPSKSGKGGKSAKLDKSGKGGKTEGGRSRRGRGTSHNESDAGAAASDQPVQQDPVAAVVTPVVAPAAPTSTAATTVHNDAPTTPTPRARGTRRRVTRSAGPAQTAEPSSDVSTDTP